MIQTSAYRVAERFIGIKEIDGIASNAQILAMLRLDQAWPEGDEVPWCSALVNYVAWLLRLPRSKSLRARSWLQIGVPVSLEQAKADADVVILTRGGGDQPGPEVIEAPGHVGFFASYDAENEEVWVLAGNQGNAVNIKAFSVDRILGLRRLAT